MNSDLIRAFHTAFQRINKTDGSYYVVPYKNNVFLSKTSVPDNIFYVVKGSGLLLKYRGKMIFNLGMLDKLKIND